MKIKIITLIAVLIILLVSTFVNAYTEKSGNVSGQVWDAGTYLITGNLTVNNNTTLTINEGAVVKFKPGLRLSVYGTLDVKGTEAIRVIFTSQDDNTHGEVIPASDGEPLPGDWEGIALNGWSADKGIGNFDWCIVRYGGAGTDFYANVCFAYSDSGYFRNSVSEYSVEHGLRLHSNSIEISNSTFSNNNKSGVYASGDVTNLVITGNTFTNNIVHAVYLDDIHSINDCSGNSGNGNGSGFGIAGKLKGNSKLSGSFPFVIWNLEVNNNITLTIEEGVIVKFGTDNELYVWGTLNVNGTPQKPVVFTSFKDDSHGGDTN